MYSQSFYLIDDTVITRKLPPVHALLHRVLSLVIYLAAGRHSRYSREACNVFGIVTPILISAMCRFFLVVLTLKCQYLALEAYVCMQSHPRLVVMHAGLSMVKLYGDIQSASQHSLVCPCMK